MNANILHPKPVPVTRFSWDAAARLFVAEASDLGPGSPFGRIYADACDEGLTLISRYAGPSGETELPLVVGHTETDREGDISWWDLQPADLSARQSGRFAFRVRVYND